MSRVTFTLIALAYLLTYTLNAVVAKFFTQAGHMNSWVYLVNQTVGSVAVCFLIAFTRGWFVHLRRARGGGPLVSKRELGVIVPAGVALAIIIPATTFLIIHGKTVLGVLLIMRGIVILSGRVIDEVLRLQGLKVKRVTWQENVAMVLVAGALAIQVTKPFSGEPISLVGAGLTTDVLLVLTLYSSAYALRLYCMNLYKARKGSAYKTADAQGWFAWEQLAATTALALGYVYAVGHPAAANVFGGDYTPALSQLNVPAVASGLFYGVSAVLAVIMLMVPAESATFAVVANRSMSLMAGIFATAIGHALLHTPAAGPQDWMALVVLALAMYLLESESRSRR